MICTIPVNSLSFIHFCVYAYFLGSNTTFTDIVFSAILTCTENGHFGHDAKRLGVISFIRALIRVVDRGFVCFLSGSRLQIERLFNLMTRSTKVTG